MGDKCGRYVYNDKTKKTTRCSGEIKTVRIMYGSTDSAVCYIDTVCTKCKMQGTWVKRLDTTRK